MVAAGRGGRLAAGSPSGHCFRDCFRDERSIKAWYVGAATEATLQTPDGLIAVVLRAEAVEGDEVRGWEGEGTALHASRGVLSKPPTNGQQS